MSAAIYLEYLRDADGNLQTALQRACAEIEWLGGRTSFGYVRAAPVKPVRAAKPIVAAIDVPRPEEAADL